MSEEQLKAFLEKVKHDLSLQEKLKAIKDVEAAVDIAMSAGFVVSSDEILKSFSYDELSQTELENLAGGGGTGYLNSQGHYFMCQGTARYCTYGDCS